MKRLILLWILIPCFANGQLKIARIFSSNMVLQRNFPIIIWGKAFPGKEVKASLYNQNIKVITAADSTWRIVFKKQKANSQSQSLLIISGSQKIELNNILVGDVWLCSGQSNMEFPMKKEQHWQQEIKQASQPLIRLNNPSPAGRYVYGVPYTDSLNKRLNTTDFYNWNGWTNCNSITVQEMTAIGYYFAKAIVEKEQVPIGLINLSIGGAPIETFISRDALQTSKQFSQKVKGDWLNNNNLPEWIRERGRQNVGGNANGFKDDIGLNHAYKPGFAFTSGIKPIVDFAIKGVLWYQGESNSLEKERVEEYNDLMKLMIKEYRSKWKQPAMPFYWVQLSSIDTAYYQSKYWPQFRNEQRLLLDEVDNGGMAVTSDIGFKDNVHPTNKKAVAERLARWALFKTYKVKVTPSGPLPLHAAFANGSIVVSFKFANGLKTSDGKSLRGFSLDGKSTVDAFIQKDVVVIHCMQKPAFVYYGWQPFGDANLVNNEDLPASTFKIKVK